MDALFPVFFKLSTAFLAAFAGLAILSKTHNPSWILVIIGSMFYVIDAVYETLVVLGLFDESMVLIQGIISGIPNILLFLAFIIFITRKR